MVDRSVQLVVCGLNDRAWNLKVVETLKDHLSLMDYLSVHQYWTHGPALSFSEDDYYKAFGAAALVEEDIQFTDDILRFFSAGKHSVGIAFDEWGIWHPEAGVSSQFEAPGTVRDAVVGAGVLDVFHKWCHRVTTANIAQIVNVLQALVQTKGDKMWLTPTYHLFDLYAPHRGASAVRAEFDSLDSRDALPLLSASASKKEGQLVVSLSNRHKDQVQEVTLTGRGAAVSGGILRTLAGAASAHNTVDEPNAVSVVESPLSASSSTLTLTLPPCSVQTLTLATA